MAVKEIEAKSILRKYKKIDSWFVSRYGMNLYNGCVHNCSYCDGRAEKYQVEGDFGRDITVKTNAVEILDRELNPKRKRVPLKKSFMILGGGVCDCYQPVEKKYRLSREVLKLFEKYKFPVHVLTKSTLVSRDLDLISRINEQSRAVVSFSFSTVDEKLARQLEPGVPSPKERLETMSLFKKQGIACGMFLMPVVPFLTDSDQMMDQSLLAGIEAGIDFVIFGGMTLKKGRQNDHFLEVVQRYFPELKSKISGIYGWNQWGQADAAYYTQLHARFYQIAKRYGLPVRMPLRLYRDLLDENDLVTVILEQIDYLLKLNNHSSPYSLAAFSISKIKESLASMKGDLTKLKGVGQVTERIILEILEKRDSAYYQALMSYQTT